MKTLQLTFLLWMVLSVVSCSEKSPKSQQTTAKLQLEMATSISKKGRNLSDSSIYIVEIEHLIRNFPFNDQSIDLAYTYSLIEEKTGATIVRKADAITNFYYQGSNDILKQFKFDIPIHQLKSDSSNYHIAVDVLLMNTNQVFQSKTSSFLLLSSHYLANTTSPFLGQLSVNGMDEEGISISADVYVNPIALKVNPAYDDLNAKLELHAFQGKASVLKAETFYQNIGELNASVNIKIPYTSFKLLKGEQAIEFRLTGSYNSKPTLINRLVTKLNIPQLYLMSFQVKDLNVDVENQDIKTGIRLFRKDAGQGKGDAYFAFTANGYQLLRNNKVVNSGAIKNTNGCIQINPKLPLKMEIRNQNFMHFTTITSRDLENQIGKFQLNLAGEKIHSGTLSYEIRPMTAKDIGKLQ